MKAKVKFMLTLWFIIKYGLEQCLWNMGLPLWLLLSWSWNALSKIKRSFTQMNVMHLVINLQWIRNILFVIFNPFPAGVKCNYTTKYAGWKPLFASCKKITNKMIIYIWHENHNFGFVFITVSTPLNSSFSYFSSILKDIQFKYLFTHIHTHTHMYIYIYIYIYCRVIYIYIYIHKYKYIHIYIYIYIYRIKQKYRLHFKLAPV